MEIQSYMLCAVPRTGSYLLCDFLEKTGVAGRPNEYFNESFQVQWTVEWGTHALDDYLAKVLRLGTTDNGVFGLKVHPMQFDSLCRQLANRPRVPFVRRPALLAPWFPDLHYIRLRRQDRLRQAISYVRAIQTNDWWDSDYIPGPSAPVQPERVRFDFQFIESALELLQGMDQRWSHYFRAIGVTPHEVTYEELERDPASVVTSVLEVLGLAASDGMATTAVPFRRQADTLTDEWVERYERIRNVVPFTSRSPALGPRTQKIKRFRQWA
jgi:trehalose 2-sulfotransferase